MFVFVDVFVAVIFNMSLRVRGFLVVVVAVGYALDIGDVHVITYIYVCLVVALAISLCPFLFAIRVELVVFTTPGRICAVWEMLQEQ